MSLYIKCDLCGEMKMHPAERDENQSLRGELDDWLMMDDFDFCLNCLLHKLDVVKMQGDRYVLKESFNENEIEKIVKERGV